MTNNETTPSFSKTGSWMIPQKAPLLADLTGSNQDVVTSEVRAVRRLGLAVVIPEDASIRAGDWIEQAVVRTSLEETLTLRFLQVQSRQPDSMGTWIELRTDDPRSVADLWNYLYERRHADPEHGASVRSVEKLKVPAKGQYDQEGLEKRQRWLEEVFGQEFPNMFRTSLAPDKLRGNIDNYVGTVELPVGIAGPMMFHGGQARGLIPAPMATSEGALVASASRGARAVTVAGGVVTHIAFQRMVRAPVFVLEDLDSALRMQAWISDHQGEIRDQIAQVGRHANLLQLDQVLIGRYLHLRFIFETGDAAGQNMTTLATWRACQWIRAQIAYLPAIRISAFYVEANTSGDKKATRIGYLGGRGFRVTAEALLPPIALNRLRVSANDLLAAAEAGTTGSMYAGMFGMNVNFANVIAAIYAATGQDIASVGESAVGQFHLEPWNDGVRATVLLPNLIVGAVGGGTKLPAQKECLQMLGAYGRAKAGRLAEIIAGYCLALDLSTLSAIAAGQFASSHASLGRDDKTAHRLDEKLTGKLCFQGLRKWLRLAASDDVQVDEVKPVDQKITGSVLQDFRGTDPGTASLRVYQVRWRMSGTDGTSRFLVKSKPTDHEVIRAMGGVAKLCGEPLASLYEAHQYQLGMRNSHLRELEIARVTDERFTSIAPEFLGTWRDDTAGLYVLVMEFLENVSHMNTAMKPQAWKTNHVQAALRGIAKFHSIYLGDTDELENQPWLDNASASRMQKLAPFWEAVLEHNARHLPQSYTPARVELMKRSIGRIGYIWSELKTVPNTLIHNDFNLRNVCLRQDGPDYRLCAYDWELATVHVPQRDVCEFLSFVLPPGTDEDVRLGFLEDYRRALEQESAQEIDKQQFIHGYNLACHDYAITRLSLLSIAQGLKVYDFLPRVLHSHFECLSQCEI